MNAKSWIESWGRAPACDCLLCWSLQVVGSSLGVLAAYSAAEGNQSLRQLVFLLVLSVVAAAVTTATCSWLVGDILHNVSFWGGVGLHRHAYHCCVRLTQPTGTQRIR